MTKKIVITNVKDRDYKRGGRIIQGSVDAGHNAEIVPGESIRLYGVDNNRRGGPVVYDLIFKVGDLVERDSFNLTYIGKIVSIGEKLITIADEDSGRQYKLNIYDFSHRNRDFDLEKIRKRNSEWMD